VTPLEHIRSTVSIETVIGRYVALKRVGGVLKGVCPFHGEKTPSFVVYRESFHCFGCGERGDVTDFIIKLHKVNYQEAFKILGSDALIAATPIAAVSYEVQAGKRQAEISKANAVWRAARSIEPESPAGAYLALRGIPAFARSKALRFYPFTYHPGRSCHPALIGNIQGPDGDTIGVHRTYLTDEGRKAPVDPPKAVKGTHMGGAVRLHPAGPVLLVAEGIETAASASMIFRLPAWSAVSSQNMARAMVLPAEVTDVVIAADHDGVKGEQKVDPGLEAARRAKRRWNMEGRIVRIFCPFDVGVDFNDLWVQGCGTEYKEVL
jgi:hypothetical protein